MSVVVHCPNSSCKQEFRVKEEMLGKSAKCKSCGTTFVLRVTEAAPSDAREVSISMLKDEPPPAPVKPAVKVQTSAPTPTPPSSSGSNGTIGRFEVRKRLGAGAFGTVYLAYDPQLQRELAIKVPQKTVLSNPQRVERFLREARSAAKLRHPNIVPVYDAGQSGKQLYIASAFVKGEPLSEIVDDGGIDLKKATTIVRGLAEGLAYAHQEGVVHRDVKPANVMLDDLGQPLLMDFGLAAQVDSIEEFQLPEQQADADEGHDDSRLTRAGSIMGTPSYMAPEIAGGLKGEAKPAADQYALGVVLYELVTGRTPFEGPPAAVLHQAINNTPPNPKEFRKDLPKDLETICLKALAKDPQDRYVTCQALADDLRRWQDGEPIRARRRGLVERARAWMKKEPRLAMLSGGMAVAVLVIIGLLLVMFLDRDEKSRIAEANADKANRERNALEVQRQLENEAAAKALTNQRVRAQAEKDRDLANEKLAAGDLNAAYALLTQIPEENRGPAWPFQVAQAQGMPEFRQFLPGPTSQALVFQLDNRHLLQVSNSNELLIRDTSNGRVVRRIPIERIGLRVQSAAISGDGKRIATHMARGFGGPPAVGPKIGEKDPPPPQSEIVIWDMEGKLIRALPSIDGMTRFALNSDGTLLAVAGSPGAEQKLSLWNVETGERLPATDKTLASVPFPLGPVVFSPDGKLVATTTALEKGEIRAWEIASGEEKFVIKDRGGDIRQLAFSPDSTRLAASGGAELEGPEFTTERPVFETREIDVDVEMDGTIRKEKRTISVSKTVTEKHVGYRNPKLTTYSVSKCFPVTKERILQKPVSVWVEVPVQKVVKVEKEINGKKVITEETVTFKEKQVETKMVSYAEKYTVMATETTKEMVIETDPVVRVWELDGNLQTKFAETGPITAMAWRDDGVMIATATTRRDPCDGKSQCQLSCGPSTGDRADVKFWDPATGKLSFALPCSNAHVEFIAFSPDHKHIAVSSFDGITLWSTESRSLLANQSAAGPVTDLLFSPDNAYLSGHSACNQMTQLWDVPTWRQAARLPGTGPFMQFLPNSRFLSSPPQNGNGISRWTARDGNAEKHPGNQSFVWAYSADGKRFVAGSLTSGKDLAVFDGQTGVRVCDLASSIALGAVRKLQVSQDGSRVAACNGHEAVLWDGASGKVLARKWNLALADLSEDGKRWAVATQPNMGYGAPPTTIPVMPMPQPKQDPKKEPKKGGITAAPTMTAEQVEFDTEDRPLFVVQKEDPLPQPKTKEDLPKDKLPVPKGGPAPIVAPTATVPQQPTITVFDGDGKEVAKLSADFTNFFNNLVFDPTGKCLIAVCDNTRVRIWNVATGQQIGQHQTNSPDVAISPDGRFLALHMAQPIFAPIQKEMPKVMPAPKDLPKANPEPLKKVVVDHPLPLTFAAQTADVTPPTYAPAVTPVDYCGPPMLQSEQDECEPKPMWIAVIDMATGKLAWQASVCGTGHGEMAFSQDGTRLALGYVDGKIGYVQLWDNAAPPNGETFKYEAVARYQGHVGPVNVVAFSPDGKLLASGGDDRLVKIWTLPAEGEFGPGSQTQSGYYGGGFGPVNPPFPAPKVMPNPPTPKEKIPAPAVSKPEVETNLGSPTFGQGVKCMTVCFVGNRLLLTNGQSGGALAWEMPSGKLLYEAKNSGWDFAVSGDGSRVASVESDGTISLWDARDWRLLKSWKSGYQFFPELQLDHQGTRVLSTWRYSPGLVKVWDADGKLLREFPGPATAALSRDGKRVAIGFSARGGKGNFKMERSRPDFDDWFVVHLQKEDVKEEFAKIQIIEVDSGNVLKTIAAPQHRLQWLALRPDEKMIATASHNSVSLWEVETGKELHEIKGFDHEMMGPGQGIRGVRFSNDGATLAVGVFGEDKRLVHLIDVATGKRRHEIDARGNLAYDFSGDGKSIALATNFGGFYVWDVTTGKEIPRPAADTSPFAAIHSSPDGKSLLLAGKDGTLRRWDVASKVKQSIDLGQFFGQFSSDGTKLAATGPDGSVRLWEVATGKLLHTFNCPKPARFVSMTPNADRLIAYCNNNDGRDNDLVVFDAKSGAELSKREWPNQLSPPIAFSPDGKSFVVTHWMPSKDGPPKATLKFFDLADISKEKRSIEAPSLGPVLYRSDGKVLYTVGHDAVLRELDIEKGTETASVALGLQATGGSHQLCFVGLDRIATLNALGTVTVVRLMRTDAPPEITPPIQKKVMTKKKIADPAGERKAAEAARKLKASIDIINDLDDIKHVPIDQPLPDTPFELRNVRIDGATLNGPEELSALKSSRALKLIHLTGCKLADDSLVPLRDLPVVYLNLQGSALNDKHIADIGLCKNLEMLGIQWTNRGNDADIEKLTSLSELKTLNICDCPITHKASVSIAKFKKLEHLYATGVRISGSDFARLGDLPNLRDLNLHKADINDADLESLKAPKLEYLNVDFTKLTSKSVQRLKEFKSLKSLSSQSVFSSAELKELRMALPNLNNNKGGVY